MPERKTLNKDLFYRGSSANLPRLHTCKNKVPFWDFSQFAVTIYINQSLNGFLVQMWNCSNRFTSFFFFFFFIYCGLFCPHLGNFFFLFLSYTTFRPHFTSGLLQVIFNLRLRSLVSKWFQLDNYRFTIFHNCSY